MPYFNRDIETMERGDLDSLIDERVRYTVKYAAENSPFYRRWFREQNIRPEDVREHEDLIHLPLIKGSTIRQNQPPETDDFFFRSAPPDEIFTIHETSGTSGAPKAFFLTWDDWRRYADKYARIFISQGFGPGDRLAVCASYGMNVGANTMTLAARKIGFTIIPEGKCTFPVRVIRNYRPTGIVGSVFKLLRLARRLEAEGIHPSDSGIEHLIVGGESFAEESRACLEEIWEVDCFNTYGSTEGTMCGECSQKTGLHVPEDLVHIDLYDPLSESFVKDGDCGRIVLTSLLPPGGRSGNVLINYDTDDTSLVLSRDRCTCGRTHMKILNPQREAETVWLGETPVNKVDIERGVFQRENLDYINGEFEAFLYGGEGNDETIIRISVECRDSEHCGRQSIEDNFLSSFFRYKPGLEQDYHEGSLKILFNFVGEGGLELHSIKGRPKRFVDRR